MKYEKFFLFPDNEDAYIETYVADPLPGFTAKALLIIPGGGYGEVCSDREGEPIALAFLPRGYNCFVLHYSVGGKRVFPSQLIEASAAIKYIKDNAEKYNIDPNAVFAMGFSAGGHLAASLGTLWYLEDVYRKLEMPFGYNKPAGLMLVYPVITGEREYSHFGSVQNLLGKNEPSDEEIELVSLENRVDERSASAFLVHTSNDPVVSVVNSLRMAEAYRKAGKTFELHIYPDAPHGIALGNEITRCNVEKWCGKDLEQWVNAADIWAKSLV